MARFQAVVAADTCPIVLFIDNRVSMRTACASCEPHAATDLKAFAACDTVFAKALNGSQMHDYYL